MPDIAVSLRPTGGSAVTGHARHHSVTVDRPADKGGSDSGPMGGEYLLLALGGCYLSTFLAALRAEDAEAEATDLAVTVTGTLTPAPTRFTEITVAVGAPAARRDLFDKPLLKAERGCIVHQSVREAITVRFTQQWL
ncbi:OsmC family protein [Streptomyces olivaceiscleroticus]|uniref:Osmotically inducible protein OsmC n=1 Tax=Streptomyces olivaceiscleroticus TaxID=68245 RepID=A0ABN1ARW9_9ACTN